MKLLTLSPLLALAPSALGLATPKCQTNKITAAEIVNGSVGIDTSPTLPFQSPALTTMNSTAWEYWYFDGVSHSTFAGITITFFRDPSLMAAGLGPLRLGVDAVWENGTQFTSMIFADESVIETCGDVTTGRWTGAQINSTFEFQHGSQTAKITLLGTSITGDLVSGTFTLRSISNARYPSGALYPDARASVQMAPLLSWNEGVPAGDVTTDVVLKGTPLQFSGIGGTDRNFAPYIWDFLADHWWWVRAVTGPYALVYWKFVSGIDKKTYSWAYLECDGKPVFKSAVECAGDKAKSECAVFSPTEGGKVKGSFNDPSTGFDIEFKTRGRSWEFHIEHQNVVFEAPGSSNDEYSRFVNKATGGEKGGRKYEGASKSEQNQIKVIFPVG